MRAMVRASRSIVSAAPRDRTRWIRSRAGLESSVFITCGTSRGKGLRAIRLARLLAAAAIGTDSHLFLRRSGAKAPRRRGRRYRAEERAGVPTIGRFCHGLGSVPRSRQLGHHDHVILSGPATTGALPSMAIWIAESVAGVDELVSNSTAPAFMARIVDGISPSCEEENRNLHCPIVRERAPGEAGREDPIPRSSMHPYAARESDRMVSRAR